MMKKILALFLVAHCAYAHPEMGVRAQSFGGAYRAVSSSNDSIFYNPAGLIKKRRLGADADYLVRTDAARHLLGVSVVDSESSAWGLGLAYNAGINAKTDMPATHRLYLSVAMPIVTEMFSLGTSFFYVNETFPDDDPYRHFFNMDMALMARFSAGLSFALVLDHLLPPKGQEKPFGISFGSAFEMGEVVEDLPLTMSFDWSMGHIKSDGNLNHSLGAGLQYVAYSVLPLRLGFKSDLKDNDNLFSIGAGILTKSFALDGLYQQHLTIGKIRHFGLALRIEI